MKEYTVRLDEDTTKKLLTLAGFTPAGLEGTAVESERVECALRRLVNDTYDNKAQYLVGWVDNGMDRDGDKIIGCFEASLHLTFSSAVETARDNYMNKSPDFLRTDREIIIIGKDDFYANVGKEPLKPVWSSREDEFCQNARSDYLKTHKTKDVERD